MLKLTTKYYANYKKRILSCKRIILSLGNGIAWYWLWYNTSQANCLKQNCLTFGSILLSLQEMLADKCLYLNLKVSFSLPNPQFTGFSPIPPLVWIVAKEPWRGPHLCDFKWPFWFRLVSFEWFDVNII